MSSIPAPDLGVTKDQLDTPCLLVDLDKFERNIRRMSDTCRTNNVAWRPHLKSHKSTIIGRKIIEAGAIGLTCAKLGEAEVMAAAGIRDLLIANPLVGPLKLKRLAALGEVADPIAVVDHPDQVDALAKAMAAASKPLRVVIEVDIGLHRCGTQPGPPAVALARLIDQAPSLELTGIMGYEGHLLMVEDPAEKERKIRESIALLASTKQAMEEAGLACPIVSAGGTGSYQITAALPGLTELQAGGGIFMDLFYSNACQVTGLEFALTILVSVTSRPAPDRAIIDAGRKTMNQELHVPEVHGRDDLRLRRLSAEHGELEVLHGSGPRVGERLEMIPGYGDLTTVLHDRFYCMRDERLEAIWPLEARGRLQ